MDMPLLRSTGTGKNYPRNMVLMNAAQVEEQAQQWISLGIWSWSLKRRPVIQQGQQAAIHWDARSNIGTCWMRNTSCQGWCRCPDRRDNCTICNALRNYPGWRWHGSACVSEFSCQGRFLWSLLQTRDQVRNNEESTMLEHQVCAKSTGTWSLQQYVVCSCHPRLWYNFSGIQHVKMTRSRAYSFWQALHNAGWSLPAGECYTRWHIKRRRSSTSMPAHRCSGWQTVYIEIDALSSEGSQYRFCAAGKPSPDIISCRVP